MIVFTAGSLKVKRRGAISYLVAPKFPLQMEVSEHRNSSVCSHELRTGRPRPGGDTPAARAPPPAR